MRSIRALFIAATALTGLSACVGTDPPAALRSGRGTALASLPAPAMDPVAPEPVEASERLSAALPGELLVDPRGGPAGIDPVAILNRSGSHSAATRSPRRSAPALPARLEEPPPPSPMRAARAPAGPMFAAHLPTSHAPMVRAGPSAAPPSELIPLAEVEARAETERRAQARRDQRFDAQIRRASSLVCDGCVSAPARKRAPAERRSDDAEQ